MKYDTSIYDGLPVTVIIYEAVRDESGGIRDYRIVYGNRHFAEDYREIYGKEQFLGALAVEEHLIDEYTLQMMNRASEGELQPFSTYIPNADLHVLEVGDGAGLAGVVLEVLRVRLE